MWGVVNEVKEKAEMFSTVAKLKQEARYMKKAGKIEASMRRKDKFMDDTRRSIRQKLEQEQQRQRRLYEQRQKAQEAAISSLAESLRLKDEKRSRTDFHLQVPPLDSRPNPHIERRIRRTALLGGAGQTEDCDAGGECGPN